MLLKKYSSSFKLFFLLTWFAHVTINAATCPNPSEIISNNVSSLSKTQSQVSMDTLGNAIAIWREIDTFNLNESRIQTSNYTPGIGWSPEVTIITVPSNIALSSPQIAISQATGNAVAVWRQGDVNTGVDYIYSSQRPFNTGVWGPIIQVSRNHVVSFDFNVNGPLLAINDSGYAVALWKVFDLTTSSNYLESAELQFGANAWANIISVAGQADYLTLPKIAVDPAGTAYAIWFNSTTSILQTATLSINGVAWSAATNLTGVLTSGPNPDIQTGSAGFAAAAWIYNDSNIKVIQASIYQGGSWSSPEEISDNLANIQVDACSVAVDANDDVSVVWNGFLPFSLFVQSNYRPFATGIWGAPEEIISSNSDLFSFPQVVFGEPGNTYAIWTSGSLLSPSGQEVLQYSYAQQGGSWASPVCTIISPPGVRAPHIAAIPTGQGVIVFGYDDQQKIQAATFPVAAPTVISITPNEGAVTGGNSVIITGSDFSQITSIEFGLGNFSPNFTVISPTLIVAVVPAGILGTVDVRVTNGAGTSAITPGDQYTYIAASCYQR